MSIPSRHQTVYWSSLPFTLSSFAIVLPLLVNSLRFLSWYLSDPLHFPATVALFHRTEINLRSLFRGVTTLCGDIQWRADIHERLERYFRPPTVLQAFRGSYTRGRWSKQAQAPLSITSRDILWHRIKQQCTIIAQLWWFTMKITNPSWLFSLGSFSNVASERTKNSNRFHSEFDEGKSYVTRIPLLVNGFLQRLKFVFLNLHAVRSNQVDNSTDPLAAVNAYILRHYTMASEGFFWCW